MTDDAELERRITQLEEIILRGQPRRPPCICVRASEVAHLSDEEVLARELPNSLPLIAGERQTQVFRVSEIDWGL
jgi:hypothetical protein